MRISNNYLLNSFFAIPFNIVKRTGRVCCIIYFIIFTPLFFNACSSASRYTAKYSEEKSFGNNTENAAELLKEENIDLNNFHPLETEIGVASYYADKYNGRQTASGEIYNMNGISAAHPSFSMGTIVKITNLSNDLSIILKINDRMPDFKNRVIDLSLGAAQKLGMIQSGIAKVKIEVIKWGKEN
jgi:peptidoglycan lytic transglycosylase